MADNNCKIELKCHSQQYIIIRMILIIICYHMYSHYRETD